MTEARHMNWPQNSPDMPELTVAAHWKVLSESPRFAEIFTIAPPVADMVRHAFYAGAVASHRIMHSAALKDSQAECNQILAAHDAEMASYAEELLQEILSAAEGPPQ